MTPSAEDTSWGERLMALSNALGVALGGTLQADVRALFPAIKEAAVAFTADPSAEAKLSLLEAQVHAMGGTEAARDAAVATLKAEIATLDAASSKAEALNAIVAKAEARTDFPEAPQQVRAPTATARTAAAMAHSAAAAYARCLRTPPTHAERPVRLYTR